MKTFKVNDEWIVVSAVVSFSLDTDKKTNPNIVYGIYVKLINGDDIEITTAVDITNFLLIFSPAYTNYRPFNPAKDLDTRLY